MTPAYNRGCSDYRKAKAEHRNPYPKDSQRYCDWRIGWHAADNDHRKYGWGDYAK